MRHFEEELVLVPKNKSGIGYRMLYQCQDCGLIFFVTESREND